MQIKHNRKHGLTFAKRLGHRAFVSYDYSAYGKLKFITGSMANTLDKDKDYRNRKERSLFETEKSAFKNPIRIFAL